MLKQAHEVGDRAFVAQSPGLRNGNIFRQLRRLNQISGGDLRLASLTRGFYSVTPLRGLRSGLFHAHRIFSVPHTKQRKRGQQPSTLLQTSQEIFDIDRCELRV